MLNRLIFCFIPTYIKAASVAKKVAIKIGKNTSAGVVEPFVALIAKILTGMIVRPEAFKTKNIICALVAFSGSGFKVCNSFIAFNPIGVAALSSPNIFAEIFIIIEPIAGWSFGTSGNIFENNGDTNLVIFRIAPPASPTFIKPIHKHNAPVKNKEISNPFLAASNNELIIFSKIVRSCQKINFPNPIDIAIRNIAINILFNNI